MEIAWRSKARFPRGGARAAWFGLAVVLVAGAAVAGGLSSRAKVVQPLPTPLPTIAPTPQPTPEPTPAPTPTPTPAPVAQIGSEAVHEAEQRLDGLGYWTGPIDGVLDAATKSAVVAFQKVEGRKRNGTLTPDELQAIRAASRPRPRVAGYRHIEVDLARQVLFFVQTGGTVERVLPVSSGSGKRFTADGWTRRAVTPRGRFTIYRKIAGWRTSPLGRLYYPNYVVGGIAIHGYSSVPVYPASHGCIRVPMFAARPVSAMLPVGTPVIVHDGGPLTHQEPDVASPPGMDNPDATVAPAPTPSPSPDTATPTPSGSPTTAPSPVPTVIPDPSPTPSATPTPAP